MGLRDFRLDSCLVNSSKNRLKPGLQGAVREILPQHLSRSAPHSGETARQVKFCSALPIYAGFEAPQLDYTGLTQGFCPSSIGY